MPQIVLDPDIADSNTSSPRWMVLIYNNDSNSMDEVVEILILATGCGLEEAEIETWEAHVYGKASVHFASKEECEEVAKTISCIGVRTEVTLEWKD